MPFDHREARHNLARMEDYVLPDDLPDTFAVVCCSVCRRADTLPLDFIEDSAGFRPVIPAQAVPLTGWTVRDGKPVCPLGHSDT